MGLRQSALRSIVVVIAVLVAIVGASAAAFAHTAESGHIHQPANSTQSSAIWCVHFTQDPGIWRPEGQDSVEASLLGDERIVFFDCDEVLRKEHAIESNAEGLPRWTVVPAGEVTDEPAEEIEAEPTEEVDPFTVQEWTKHQRTWLKKGDKLVARLTKARTVKQARRAMGSFQKHLAAETKWLRRNADRFEPESCLANDMADWQKRVRQAQKGLNKAVTAMNRGNLSALNSQIRQFARAWTKVEQIYNIARCDF